ncbi:hypothetical protein GCM10007108_16850 [Thermogymnomonas acidicola]|uniref:DUF2079 domain-containing protein n=1 Tax=Thermogymnomonas acidicola TaxID=399579 RepID=A0AA37BSN2_9ARCH|nr:DUF2079 domain-containing protein [Thermogymnomonas acidicola]GGM79255.1 hypothetical protein GCM10007108_16850 [Thermogymnomonas acidicola]
MARRLGYQEWILIAEIAVYSAVWSYISLMRYLHFGAAVFDLGVASATIYKAFHGGIIGTAADPRPIQVQKLIYLVLAPFYDIDPRPEFLLVFQSIWIPLGAVPLFLASRKLGMEKTEALLIASSYLLYFPLAGVNWFDFHFMALFPTFFLLCLYAYVSDRKALFGVTAVLATITDLMVPLIMFAFAVYAVIEGRYRGKRCIPYTVLPASAGALVFLAVSLYFGPGYLLNWLHLGGHGSILSMVSDPGGPLLTRKVMWFILMSIPPLFMYLLSPRSAIMFIPYVLFVAAYSYTPYFTVTLYQYPALYSPVIIYSAAKGYAFLRSKIGSGRAKYALFAVLAVSLITYSLFSPVGEAFTYQYTYGHDPNLSNVIPPYTLSQMEPKQYDTYMWAMVRMVPPGTTVLLQNDEPQLATVNNVVMPWSPVPELDFNYSLANPYSKWFYPGAVISPGAVTYFQTWFNYALLSGEYSIVSEEDGLTLISLGQHSGPVAFSPVNVQLEPVSSGTGYCNYTTGFLPPGTYVVVNGSINDTLRGSDGISDLVLRPHLGSQGQVEFVVPVYLADVTLSAPYSGHVDVVLREVSP